MKIATLRLLTEDSWSHEDQLSYLVTWIWSSESFLSIITRCFRVRKQSSYNNVLLVTTFSYSTVLYVGMYIHTCNLLLHTRGMWRSGGAVDARTAGVAWRSHDTSAMDPWVVWSMQASLFIHTYLGDTSAIYNVIIWRKLNDTNAPPPNPV